MRILILTLNYAPEPTGIGKFNGEMVEWLANRGHEIHVVTAPPYYPKWKVWHGYSAFRYLLERNKNILVWRCPLWVPGNQSGLKRLLHLLSFAVSSFPIMMLHTFWRPDVVFVTEPPLFCAPSAWFCARLARAKCWLHVQDFEVDAAFNLGMIPGRLKNLTNKFERWLMSSYDNVSSISERMLEKVEAKGVQEAKKIYFPNWVDTKKIYPLDDTSRYRHLLGIDEQCFVALYSGNMGEKQGIEVVIEAAKKSEDDPRIQFVLCGEGAAYSKLQKLSLGVTNIHWLPLQPVDKLNELLNMADVHLLPQRADAEDLVMPSKLSGMLASGRPVVATANEGTQISKTVCGAGIIVPPGNSIALLVALREMLENPSLRYRMGKAGRDYAVEFLEMDIVLSDFEQGLKACVGREYI